MADNRIKRLEEIESELHDIANSFAGNKTGVVAVNLHQAAMGIRDCIRMAEDGVNAADKLAVAEKWVSQQRGKCLDPRAIAKML